MSIKKVVFHILFTYSLGIFRVYYVAIVSSTIVFIFTLTLVVTDSFFRVNRNNMNMMIVCCCINWQ